MPEHFLTESIKYLLGGFVAALAWVVRLLFGKISRLEERFLDKSDHHDATEKLHRKLAEKLDRLTFSEYQERAEVVRTEMRQGQQQLFEKIDQLKTLVMQAIQEIKRG